MKINRNEFMMTLLAVMAVVLSVWIFNPASGASAKVAERGRGYPGPGYPGPHATVTAPLHFPWDKMPTLPPQAAPEHVPPPFNPGPVIPGRGR